MAKSFFLLLVSSTVLWGYTNLLPSLNGTSPGCSGGGCHSFSNGIVSVKVIDSVNVEVTISGVSSGKPVAGELVNSSGTVVDYINKTNSNPFILTANEPGDYIVNAGYKSPSKKWDSTSVKITNSPEVNPDSSWQSNIIITEIMFDVPKDLAGDANGDGVRGSHSDEFIELYNNDSLQADLSGYQILDREGIAVFEFPNGAILNPFQFAVVFGAVGSAGYGNNIPSATKLFAVHQNDDNNDGFDNHNGKTNFSNSGDCVLLINPALNDTLAEIYWGSAAPVSSKPIYLGFPNTKLGGLISGAIRESVTHPLNNILWDLHSVISNDTENLFSPGYDVFQPTDVETENKTPVKYELMHNYPNPFNPTTVIKYSVPIIENDNMPNVKITVTDILGHEIKKLVNEKKSVGKYEVKFNENNLPSGIYFYTIQVGKFLETKKMMLLK